MFCAVGPESRFMMSILFLVLPLVFVPVLAFVSPFGRLRAMQVFAGIQLVLSLCLYVASGELQPVLGDLFLITPLATAFLLAYTGLQFVALLSLPRNDGTNQMIVGTLLLAICTEAVIAAHHPVVFMSAFIVSLFIPFACSLLQKSDSRGSAVFLLLGIVCSALALVGAYQGLHNDTYDLNIWLLLAAAIRLGIVPCHLWVRRMVMSLPIQWSILFFLSYPSIALLMQLKTDAVSENVHYLFLTCAWITAIYGAWLGTAQDELRTTFYYLLLSFLGAIGVGVAVSLTSAAHAGVMMFWLSGGLAVAGFGLTVEILEARFGTLTLSGSRGLVAQVPLLGALFLLFGLASVGFPGMCAFVGSEVMLNGIYARTGWVVFPILCALSLNGITVLRWYFSIFYGPPTMQVENIELLGRERLAFLLLLAIIVGAGVYPKPLFYLADTTLNVPHVEGHSQ